MEEIEFGYITAEESFEAREAYEGSYEAQYAEAMADAPDSFFANAAS